MATLPSRFLAVLLCALPLGAAAVAAEATPTVTAFATWTLQGVAVRAAPPPVALVGRPRGPLFVDAGADPVLAGRVICPGTLTVQLADGSQQGEGVCAFTAKDGAEAYGSWTCSGYHLVGCKGSFSFTGGSGRLEGITGGSDLLIRGELLGVARATGQATGDEVLGIMLWRNLAGTLPGLE